LEFLFENILNLIGFLVGLGIGIMSFIGFKNTGSPTLFRLSIAFFSICVGFFVVWTGFMLEDFVLKAGHIERWIQTLGIGIQTLGYFFIAFSHSIKSFFPKSRYLRSVGIFPLFLVSAIHIENIFRSISFILLVYGAIETFMSYLESKKKGAIFVALGLALLAFGEFLGWYSFVFPESILYYLSISIKIGGLISLFVPVSRIPLTKIKFDEEI
jgi:hypothetical protein